MCKYPHFQCPSSFGPHQVPKAKILNFQPQDTGEKNTEEFWREILVGHSAQRKHEHSRKNSPFFSPILSDPTRIARQGGATPLSSLTIPAVRPLLSVKMACHRQALEGAIPQQKLASEAYRTTGGIARNSIANRTIVDTKAPFSPRLPPDYKKLLRAPKSEIAIAAISFAGVKSQGNVVLQKERDFRSEFAEWNRSHWRWKFAALNHNVSLCNSAPEIASDCPPAMGIRNRKNRAISVHSATFCSRECQA